MSNSITINGVLFIIYLVIAAIVFYVLGGPRDTLFDSLSSNAVEIADIEIFSLLTATY